MVESIPEAPESVLQAWLEVLGHIHPLVVHFPIALSIVAAMAMIWNWLGRHEGFGEFAFHCTWIAALASVFVSASGWFFAEGETQETRELFLHRWIGVGSSGTLVLLAFSASFARNDLRPGVLKLSRLLSIVAAAGIALTAHFGGDMVWGEGQVSKPLAEAISLSWQRMGGAPATAVQPSADPMIEPPSEEEQNPIPTLSQNGLTSLEFAMDETAPPSTAPTDKTKDAPQAAPSAPGSTPSGPSKNLEYNKDIRPIFEARCWECHGKGQAKGGIAFDHVGELIVKEKKKGIIVAEKPESSTLVKVIKRSATTKGHMPPKGERLSPDQIALIEAWIKQGAKVAEQAPAPG